MYVIDSTRLNQRPEIRIGDRIFGIDNRLSTFEKMNAHIKNPKDGMREFDIIIGGALGDAAYNEILEMDLPYAVMRDIVVIILAAIQDISEEEAHSRFRKS